MRSRRTRALALAVVVGLAAGACRRATDEASVRKREAGEIDGRLGATAVALYRAAKTAVRSLPPRDVVHALVGGKTELTREEWTLLMEKEPALAAYRKRVGLFVVGVHLREAAYAGALVGGAVLAARGGGRLVADPSDVPLWQLPRTVNPFGSPVAFYHECKDVLADDEDNYPTLCVSMLPGPLFEAARLRRGVFAKRPLDRITLPAFEHLALGCAWLQVQPDLALYELERAHLEDLSPIEAGVVRAARALLFARERWNYHALDELTALERELPEIGRSAAALDHSVDAAEVQATAGALVHLARYQIFLALERNDDAARELERAGDLLKDRERLRPVAHLIAARVRLDAGRYQEAAVEVRLAADSVPDAKTREELRNLADEIDRNLPRSRGGLDAARFAAGLLLRNVLALVVTDDVARWSEGFRDRTREQIDAWEKSFPAAGDLRDRGKKLWRRVLQ